MGLEGEAGEWGKGIFNGLAFPGTGEGETGKTSGWPAISARLSWAYGCKMASLRSGRTCAVCKEWDCFHLKLCEVQEIEQGMVCLGGVKSANQGID